jgi:uncharacterized protein (UPF0264 family)
VRLLVSVRDAEEAAAAIAGGADIVDAKEPAAGALGAVSLGMLQAIARQVGGGHPFSAALGDAADEESVRELAGAFVAAGADFVKVGLAGTTDYERARVMLASAAAAAGRRRVVAVAYADHWRAGSLSAADVLRVAASLRLGGVLLDTADKQGAGLRGVMTSFALAEWIEAAHRHGLVAAIAGKLTADDIAVLRSTGADILGVRGAACDGGRAGQVSTDRVSLLRALVDSPTGA